MAVKLNPSELAEHIQKGNSDMFVILEGMNTFHLVPSYEELYKVFNTQYPSIEERPTQELIKVHQPFFYDGIMEIKIKTKYSYPSDEILYKFYNKNAYDYVKKILERNLGNQEEWDKLHAEQMKNYVPPEVYGSFQALLKSNTENQ